MHCGISRKNNGIWIVSGLFLSALVGAGFATGREIFIYFAQFGFLGFVGFFLACAILVFASVRVLCGHEISPFFRAVIRLFTFCGYVTMVAGFRNILSLLFPDVAKHYPVLFGVAACGIISAFALLVLYRGFKFFAALCQIIPPLLIVCLLTISIFSIAQYGFPALPVDALWRNPAFLIRTVLYIGYNVLFLTGVLGRGQTVSGRKGNVWGSILAGFLFLAGGMGTYVVLLQNIDRLSLSTMPLCTLAQSWHWVLQYGFLGIVATAMLLCGASTLGSASGVGVRRYFTGKMLILFAVPLSYIGFDKILTVIYPIFGAMGIFLLITLAQNHKKNV